MVIYHLLQEVLSFYHASFLHLGEKIVGIELKQTIEWDTVADPAKLNRIKCANYHLNE